MSEIIVGDCIESLQKLSENSVHCCVTSPPYWGLRSYLPSDHPNKSRELGGEKSPEEYVANMVLVFEEVRRVLRADGVMWLNLGDSYAGPWSGNSMRPDGGQQRSGGPGFHPLDDRYAPRNGVVPRGLKPKDLVGIPWRVAFALQQSGWWLRSCMPWVKRAAMPSSVRDRPGVALEYVFMLTKSERYHCDMHAVRKVAAYAGKSRGGSTNRYEQNAAGMDNREYSTRNFRDSDLWFQTITAPHGAVFLDDELVGLDVNPMGTKHVHFATFPQRLVDPLIRMGTSEWGCCPVCGKPWPRILERESVSPVDYEGKHLDTEEQASGRKILANTRARREAGNNHDNPFPPPKFMGWQPACRCEHRGIDCNPCVVLDPFGGIGTVGQVAKALGRQYILIELYEEYAEIAKRVVDTPLHVSKKSGKKGRKKAAKRPSVMQLPLFD